MALFLTLQVWGQRSYPYNSPHFPPWKKSERRNPQKTTKHKILLQKLPKFFDFGLVVRDRWQGTSDWRRWSRVDNFLRFPVPFHIAVGPSQGSSVWPPHASTHDSQFLDRSKQTKKKHLGDPKRWLYQSTVGVYTKWWWYSLILKYLIPKVCQCTWIASKIHVYFTQTQKAINTNQGEFLTKKSNQLHQWHSTCKK